MALAPTPQPYRFTVEEYLAFDRGENFRLYRTWLLTLQDYVLVAPDQPLVEHYHRQEDGTWALRALAGLAAHLHLPSIGCTAELADVYDRIVFRDLVAET